MASLWLRPECHGDDRVEDKSLWVSGWGVSPQEVWRRQCGTCLMWLGSEILGEMCQVDPGRGKPHLAGPDRHEHHSVGDSPVGEQWGDFQLCRQYSLCCKSTKVLETCGGSWPVKEIVMRMSEGWVRVWPLVVQRWDLEYGCNYECRILGWSDILYVSCLLSWGRTHPCVFAPVGGACDDLNVCWASRICRFCRLVKEWWERFQE